jgi:hypothetical protein
LRLVGRQIVQHDMDFLCPTRFGTRGIGGVFGAGNAGPFIFSANAAGGTTPSVVSQNYLYL